MGLKVLEKPAHPACLGHPQRRPEHCLGPTFSPLEIRIQINWMGGMNGALGTPRLLSLDDPPKGLLVSPEAGALPGLAKVSLPVWGMGVKLRAFKAPHPGDRW